MMQQRMKLQLFYAEIIGGVGVKESSETNILYICSILYFKH